MKNYKTIIAVAAAGVALVATERHAQATLVTSGTGQLVTTAPGYTSPVAVNYFVDEDNSGLYTYVYQFADPSPGGTVNAFDVDASYVISVLGSGASIAAIITADSVGSPFVNNLSTYLAGQNLGTEVDWSFSADKISHNSPYEFAYTSAYGPTLGVASEIDGTTWTDGPGYPGSTLVAVPVPEASTVMAGALMLLPFGIGAIRSLRKDRTA